MHMVFLICLSSLNVLWADAAATDDAADAGGGRYGIILDGGSSGTKLKVFRWAERASRLDRIDIRLIDNTKFKPGISAFATALDGLDTYLRQIMEKARLLVPQGKHRGTPLYLMATAGLRTLSTEKTTRLMGRIEQLLGNQSVSPFQLMPDGVRVLSGEEEGVFAWVSANYLRNQFWSDKPPSQTVGVLEMGGGSTQIAFLPEGYVYANMFPVRLGGRSYHLYAHSYLFYGQNYIISRINEYLLALQSDSVVIENPCMLAGDSTTSEFLGTSVLITGSGNTTKCLEILSIFLRTAEGSWCYPKPCAIGRTYQPHVGSTTFFALSAFIYSPEYLEAVDTLGRLNLTLLKEHAKIHCSKTLEEALETGLSAEYASQYCTMGLYIPALLTDAYSFSENTTSVYVQGSIDDVEIDWTMGAMLLEIEKTAPDFNCETSGTRSFHAGNLKLLLALGACVSILSELTVLVS